MITFKTFLDDSVSCNKYQYYKYRPFALHSLMINLIFWCKMASRIEIIRNKLDP